MINSITLQPLRNGEFLQFLTDVLVIVNKKDPAALKVVALNDALKAKTDEAEKLFKISQSSLITQEIEQLDQRRDDAINGILALASGFGYSADAAIKKHAQALSAHLALFGNGIARDNMLSETTTIRNIVNDWEAKPELKAALTALGLTAWKTELEAANAAFYASFTARNEEFAAASPDNLRLKRLEANAAYYKLRDRLNSHFDINEGAEPWASTISLINQTIANYNALLARRGPTNPATPAPPTP